MKRTPPKPFVKGDPRINRGGRPKAVLTQAILARLTPEKVDELAEVLIREAGAGQSWAMQLLFDRVEGKVPNKHENGSPGDFDEELSDDERTRLRAALRVVRGNSRT